MKRLLPFAIIVIVLVGAVAGGWIVLRSSHDSANTARPTPNPGAEVKGAEPPHVQGNPNAPVTLEEFGDFQCPTCGSMHPEIKKIQAEFADKVKLVFREFPQYRDRGQVLLIGDKDAPWERRAKHASHNDPGVTCTHRITTSRAWSATPFAHYAELS